ncbi:MAG: FG-GAP repeat protein, partial [Candidatus Krumholzibacteria bacterium]|nr:FG-GAP repeat protein [Candidatus Krumholzibacteria bacterium]
MFPLRFTKRVPIFVPLLVTALLVAVPALAHLTLVREGRDSAGAAETEDRLGTAVAAGDFNEDGHDDLASGAPQDDHAGAADGQHHGTVVISWGSPFGLTHEGAVDLQFLDDFGDNVARFGHALAAGNFDGDPYSDLVVGVPYRDYVGAQDAGAIYVYMGSASGLTGGYTVYTQVDFGGTREGDDLFGFSLAVGDFDGNSTDDIAVGAPGEDNGAGAAFYMYSTPGIGLDALGAGAGFFKQGDLAQTPKAGENFGYALTAGSVFGGFDDLVVGAPYDQPGSGLTTPTGRVTLIPSQGGSGLGALGAIDFNSIELGVPFSHNDSWFGWSLATGRFAHAGGSGVDIAIGEPAHNAGGTFRAGRVVVYQFGAPVYAIDLSSVPGTFVLRGSEDFFGWSVASGDIDNDGLEELAVGTPNKNALNNTVNWGGMLSVFD